MTNQSATRNPNRSSLISSRVLLAVSFMGCTTAASAAPCQLMFTGAMGFGKYWSGPRNTPTSYSVTTTADYDPATESPISGSLRHRIEQVSGSRNITFSVSGTISLKKKLVMEGENDAWVIIDGGGDITIINEQFQVTNTHDIALRNLRFRQDPTGTRTDGWRSLSIGAEGTGNTFHHVNIDHCSIQAADDDAFSMIGPCHHVTVQWCLIGDGRNTTTSCYGGSCTGKGAIVACDVSGLSGSDQDATLTMCWNLFTNVTERAPNISTGGRVDFFNNASIHAVTMMQLSNKGTGGTHGSPRINIIGNFFKWQTNHPWNPVEDPIRACIDDIPTTYSIYLDNNYYHGYGSGFDSQWDLTYCSSTCESSVGCGCSPNEGRTNFPCDRQKSSAWSAGECGSGGGSYGETIETDVESAAWSILVDAGAYPRDATDDYLICRIVNPEDPDPFPNNDSCADIPANPVTCSNPPDCGSHP